MILVQLQATKEVPEEPVDRMCARPDGEPDLNAFPRIAVIHGPKSAHRSSTIHRMGLVHRHYVSHG
jgi:hypothetical protein